MTDGHKIIGHTKIATFLLGVINSANTGTAQTGRENLHFQLGYFGGERLEEKQIM